jgi:hypothetical protein
MLEAQEVLLQRSLAVAAVEVREVREVRVLALVVERVEPE